MRAEVDEAEGKSVVHCEKLVAELRNVPEFIHNDNYEEISAMRKRVQGYIDEMHIDDIFERICNLSETLRVALIGQLRKKFANIFTAD